MKRNISLQELIAINNPSKAKSLVIKYGYRPARNYTDLIQKLFRLTKEYREDALKDLVEIHPHKELILYYNSPVIKEKEIKSNCDGDAMCDKCISKQKYVNFEGENTNQNISNTNSFDVKTYLPLIAITSFLTATLVIALKGSK